MTRINRIRVDNEISTRDFPSGSLPESTKLFKTLCQRLKKIAGKARARA